MHSSNYSPNDYFNYAQNYYRQILKRNKWR